MAVYLSAQEKADIFQEAFSENCLIHVQSYFGTRNGLVDLERYRAHNWKAICEDGVVGIGPQEKVDEVFNHMERHIDDVYKHLHSDPQSVSSRTKFAFNIVTPEALRYAVCKVLKVSYGAAKFIVIFGHRERLDGDLMGPTDRKRHRRSSSSESNCILTKSSSKSRASPYKSKIGTRSSSSNERDSIRSTSRRNKEFQSRDKRHRRSSSSESNCALKYN